MDVFESVAGGARGYLRDAVVHAGHQLRGFSRPTRRLRKLHEAMRVLGVDPRALPPDRPVAPGGWGSLAEVIRTDQPLPEEAASLERFHTHLLEVGAAPARELWQLLPARGPLLDLGGGAGAYTRAFLEARPGEQATIADRPEVLKLAQAPGATLLPLDLLNISQQPPADSYATVLLANLLHLFGPEQIVRIVRFVRIVLNSGGGVIVKDLRPDTDEGALFALNMALYTEQGDVHPAESIQQWLVEAGFERPRRLALQSSPNSLVLAAAKS